MSNFLVYVRGNIELETGLICFKRMLKMEKYVKMEEVIMIGNGNTDGLSKDLPTDGRGYRAGIGGRSGIALEKGGIFVFRRI